MPIDLAIKDRRGLNGKDIILRRVNSYNDVKNQIVKVILLNCKKKFD